MHEERKIHKGAERQKQMKGNTKKKKKNPNPILSSKKS
jgi:hypothetical protein